MIIDSRCLERFFSGKIGKAIGENVIKNMMEQIKSNSADNAELALGFMTPDELQNPEADSAEILIKISIKRVGEVQG